MTENNKKQKQGITYIQIPGEGAFNKDLTKTDMFVFWMIETLDSTEKHCWASNEYIAIKLNINTQTVSNSITKLKKYKYIMQIAFNGRKRILAKDNNYHKKYRYLIEEYNSEKKCLSQDLYADYNNSYRQTKPELIIDNNSSINIEDKTIINDRTRNENIPLNNSPDKKYTNTIKLKSIKLIKYWSDLGYTINHTKNSESNLYKQIIRKLSALQKGTFKNIGPFDPEWIKKDKIPESWFIKPWTFQELKDGLKEASKYSLDGYWTTNKNYFRSLDNILFNIPYKKESGICWFFIAMKNPPETSKKTYWKNPLPETTEKLMKMDIWPKGYKFDEQRLARGLVELKEFSDNLIQDQYGKCNQWYGTLAKIVKEYTDWLYRQDWIEVHEGLIGTKNKVFKQFIEVQEKEIGIKIRSKGWK